MEEQSQPTGQESGRESLSDSWKEVGEQLKELGSQLASTFRIAWSEEKQSEQEETVRNLQNDLRAAADRLERVVKRVADETEEERSATAKATREASDRSLSEARVASISALKSLNNQLQHLLDRLEREPEKSEQPASAAPEQTVSQPGTGTEPAGTDATTQHTEPTPEP